MLNTLGAEMARERARDLRDRAAAERRVRRGRRRRPGIGRAVGVALMRAGARLAREGVPVG